MAKFIQDNETIDTFPGEVQFYITHTIDLPTGSKTHQLAFVKWYQSAQTLRPDFTAKPMMMMMKDAMLSFGRTSVTKLIEIVLFLFITFIADLYLVYTKDIHGSNAD